MTDTVLTLGDFSFTRFEVPESITFGGDQALVVHRLVGGTRVIDAMGEDPRPLEWTGYFTGASALDRARYIDTLRKAGKPVILGWSEFAYSVVIRTFECTFQRFYRLPYRIVCEVVKDYAAPALSFSTPGTDQLISSDMLNANGLVAGIGNGTLSGLMGTLNTAISGVSSFATAAQSQINAVLTPLAAVRTQVGVLLQSVSGTLSNVTTLGGIVPGNPISQQVNALSNVIGAVQDTPALINLDRTLGRVSTNINAVNGSARQVTVAGGNLFAIAAGQYGDAMGWTELAQANSVTDPNVTGIATLTVPQLVGVPDGVLNV